MVQPHLNLTRFPHNAMITGRGKPKYSEKKSVPLSLCTQLSHGLPGLKWVLHVESLAANFLRALSQSHTILLFYQHWKISELKILPSVSLKGNNQTRLCWLVLHRGCWRTSNFILLVSTVCPAKRVSILL